MEEKGMNQTRFANETGINPASLSGIINKPNDRKPTIDMVTKILVRFEDINGEWLLLGKGPVYKSDNVVFAQQATDLFSQSEPKPQESAIKQAISPPKSNDGKESKVNRQENTAQGFTVQPIIPQNQTAKKIDRVTVFYTDKTFDDFFPETK
jgi:hypothetical protein